MLYKLRKLSANHCSVRRFCVHSGCFLDSQIAWVHPGELGQRSCKQSTSTSTSTRTHDRLNLNKDAKMPKCSERQYLVDVGLALQCEEIDEVRKERKAMVAPI